MKQIRQIFRYVQKSREKKRQLDALIYQTNSHIIGMFNGLSYSEIIHFSNNIIKCLEAYIDERSPLEVYAGVKAWRYDDTALPGRIIATLDPAAWYEVDRAAHIANITILLERLANTFLPKDITVSAMRNERDEVELTAEGEVKAKHLKRCMETMQAEQKKLFNKKNKLH